jgi:hypothetical protein
LEHLLPLIEAKLNEQAIVSLPGDHALACHAGRGGKKFSRVKSHRGELPSGFLRSPIRRKRALIAQNSRVISSTACKAQS